MARLVGVEGVRDGVITVSGAALQHSRTDWLVTTNSHRTQHHLTPLLKRLAKQNL